MQFILTFAHDLSCHLHSPGPPFPNFTVIIHWSPFFWASLILMNYFEGQPSSLVLLTRKSHTRCDIYRTSKHDIYPPCAQRINNNAFFFSFKALLLHHALKIYSIFVMLYFLPACKSCKFSLILKCIIILSCDITQCHVEKGKANFRLTQRFYTLNQISIAVDLITNYAEISFRVTVLILYTWGVYPITVSHFALSAWSGFTVTTARAASSAQLQ